MNTDDKIQLAMDIISGKSKCNYKYNYIYPFTTENINGYIDMFDFKDKSLLTVGSSGDQIMNALLHGCEDITLIDVCPFAREYFFLKMAAIEYMTRREYIDFFSYCGYRALFISNKKAFSDQRMFKLVSSLEDIDKKVYYFWRQLFRHYSGIDIRSRLFSLDEPSYKALVKSNGYLTSDSEYNKLRRMIRKIYNIRFIQDDIFKTNIDRGYDNINLSNLGTCYDIDKFYALFKKMEGYLNDEGMMLVSYLFDTDKPYQKGDKEIYDIDTVMGNLPKDRCHISSFRSNTGYEMNIKDSLDSVISYKKVKKM